MTCNDRAPRVTGLWARFCCFSVGLFGFALEIYSSSSSFTYIVFFYLALSFVFSLAVPRNVFFSLSLYPSLYAPFCSINGSGAISDAQAMESFRRNANP